MCNHATKNPNLKMTTIIGCVCVAFDVSAADILGPRRYRTATRARMAAASLIRELREMSFPRIAKALNKADHTTIIHAIHRTQDLTIRDPNFAQCYAEAKALALECAANGLQWPHRLVRSDREALSGQITKRLPAVKFEAPAVLAANVRPIIRDCADIEARQMRSMIAHGTRRMEAALVGAGE